MSDEDVRMPAVNIEGSVFEYQSGADIVDIEEIEGCRSVGGSGLLDADHLAQFGIGDQRQAVQRLALAIVGDQACIRNDLGVHRVVRSHCEDTSGPAHSRGFERPLQLRIAGDDGDTEFPTQLDVRVGRVRLDDDHPLVRIAQVAHENAAHISETADHHMPAHGRDTHLLPPIANHHSQRRQTGPAEHGGGEESGNVERDRQVRVLGRNQQEQPQALVRQVRRPGRLAFAERGIVFPVVIQSDPAEDERGDTGHGEDMPAICRQHTHDCTPATAPASNAEWG